MAAPAENTMAYLDGTWVMDKNLSTPMEPLLTLQGASWMTRKAISLATLTLSVSQYKDDSQIGHIDIDQTITGGIKGTTERRTADWNGREHKDHIFGTVEGKSRFLRGSKGADGVVRPDLDMQTSIEDPQVRKFLVGELLADGSETDGFIVEEGIGGEYGEGEGLWFQSWVVNLDPGYEWTAEQVWGFEEVEGERRYTRRICVAKDGQYELARFVYSYTGPKAEEE